MCGGGGGGEGCAQCGVAAAAAAMAEVEKAARCQWRGRRLWREADSREGGEARAMEKRTLIHSIEMRVAACEINRVALGCRKVR